MASQSASPPICIFWVMGKAEASSLGNSAAAFGWGSLALCARTLLQETLTAISTTQIHDIFRIFMPSHGSASRTKSIDYHVRSVTVAA